MSGAPSRADTARHYCADLGFALVAIPLNKKGPTNTAGWNKPGGYHVDPDQASTYWSRHEAEGMGLLHGPSGTAALDIDHGDGARLAFRAVGLDLDALLALPGPHIVGNPLHPPKPIYRVPADAELSAVKLTWPNPSVDPKARPVTIFELRAGPVQDVLPPTIHPDTGKPYQWAPSPDEAPIPELPDELLDLWQRWAELLPAMRAACPWAQPAPPRAPGTGENSAEWDAVRAEVLRRYSLEDGLAELGVTLKGGKACCPFHDERVPSFWTFKGADGVTRWLCAHGGAPVGVTTKSGYSVGDAIDLYAHAHGLAAGKAAAELAARFGIKTPGATGQTTGGAPEGGPDLLARLGVRRLSEISTAAPPPLVVDRCDPLGHTILFGPGGVGKGVLACQWIVEMVLAGYIVLILDYEAHDTEWSRRIASLGGLAALERVFYVAPLTPAWRGAHGAIWTQAADIHALVEVLHATFVVVDSTIPACGGVDPMKPEAASQYAGALQYIGRPVLSLAHVTKADDQRYPFGSVFWHNLARVTWSLSPGGSNGEHSVILTHRKRNNYASLGKLLIDVRWDDGLPVEVTERRYSAALADRIVVELTAGPQTVGELVTVLNDNLDEGAEKFLPNSVRTALRRGAKATPKRFTSTGKGAAARWSNA